MSSKEPTEESKQEERNKALESFLMTFRSGRRLLGRTLSSVFSKGKCRVCKGPLGVVSLGQEKKYCGKGCRLLRHNAR